MSSMAYARTPRDMDSICQAKIQTPSNGEYADDALLQVIEPLKQLKRDLTETPPPNLFRAVRSIDENHLAVSRYLVDVE